MGELTDNESGEIVNKPDQPDVEQDERGIPTDAEGVFSDSTVKQGNNEFPVFKCSKNEFYNNMQGGRKKMRFSSGSSIQQYMQKTKYNRPFYIEHTDTDGKTYRRRVK